jgi:hypothetical protein
MPEITLDDFAKAREMRQSQPEAQVTLDDFVQARQAKEEESADLERKGVTRIFSGIAGGVQSTQEYLSNIRDSEVVDKVKNYASEYFVKPIAKLGVGFAKPISRGIVRAPNILVDMEQAFNNFMAYQGRKDPNLPVFGDPNSDPATRTPFEQRRVDRANMAVAKYTDNVRRAKKIKQDFEEAASSGWLAYPEDYDKLSVVPFTENYSVGKMFAVGLESLPVLAMAAVVTKGLNNPMAGAALIGGSEASAEFNQAIETKGMGVAGSTFVANAVVLSVLESVPLTSFLKGGSLGTQIFKVGVQEGGEEVLQKLFKDTVAVLGYDETRQITQGLVEHFVAGFISGGVIGGFSARRVQRFNELMTRAKELGVDVDGLTEAVGEQVIESADKITETFNAQYDPVQVEQGLQSYGIDTTVEQTEVTLGETSVRFDRVQAEEAVRQMNEEAGIEMDEAQIQEAVDTAEQAALSTEQTVEDVETVENTEEVQELTDEELAMQEAEAEARAEEQASRPIDDFTDTEWEDYSEDIVDAMATERTSDLTDDERLIAAELDLEYQKERKSVVDQLDKRIRRSIKQGSGEENDLIPRTLFAKQGGVSLDSLATENAEILGFLGYEASEQGLRDFIYNEIGQQGKGQKIFRPDRGADVRSAQIDVQEFKRLIKERDARVRKIVSNVRRALSKKPKFKKSVIERSVRPPAPGDVKINERDALRIKMRAAQKAAKQGEREGKRKEKARLTEIYENRKNRQRVFDDIKKKINFIKKVTTTNIPVEFSDTIKAIQQSIGAYDFVVDSKGKRRKKLTATNVIKRGQSDAFEDAELKRDVSELEKISVDNMTTDDLNEVYDVIRQLYNQGLVANKLLAADIRRTFLETVKTGAKSIRRNAPNASDQENSFDRAGKKTNKAKSLIRRYAIEQRRPEAIFEEFDGYAEGSSILMFEDTVDSGGAIQGEGEYKLSLDETFAEEVNNINYKVIFEPMLRGEQATMQAHNDNVEALSRIFSELDIFNAIHSSEKIEGFNRKVSRDEMYFIYANSLNVQNIAHLKASGVTDTMIDSVNRKLSRKEKDMINQTIMFIDGKFDDIDRVHVQLKGRHVKRVEGVYFPIKSLENVGDIEQIEMEVNGINEYVRTGVASTFTKDRAKRSERGFKNFSFFGTVNQHLRQVEHYVNNAIPIRDVSKYLKAPEVKQAIIDGYGQEMYDVIDLWINDNARGRERSLNGFWDNLLLAVRKNYVVSILGGNLSTILKQPVSYVQGAQYIGKANAVNGLAMFIKNPRQSIEFIQGKSVQMANRAFAQERVLNEIAQGRSMSRVFGQIPGLNEVLKDPRKLMLFKELAREGAMRPILLADQVTTTSLWLGAYHSQMKQHGNEQIAIDYADKAIRRTQPQSGLLHLPEMFRADQVRKMLTIFKNQPNQNINLIYDTVRKHAGAENKDFKLTKKMANDIFWYWIFGSFMFGVVSDRGLPEDEEDLMMNLVGGVANGLVGVSEVYNKVKYPYGSTNIIDSLQDSAAGVAKAKRLDTKLGHGADLVATAVGVPAYVPLKRFIERETLEEKLFGGERKSKETVEIDLF